MRFVLPLLLALAIVSITSAAAPPIPLRLDRYGDPLPTGAIIRLGTVRFQFPDDVDHPPDRRLLQSITGTSIVLLSPDGSTLAAVFPGKKGSRIAFMDASTGKVLRNVEATDVDVQHPKFTPDGKGLVCRGVNAFTLLDVQTGKVIRSSSTFPDQISVLALSPAGDLVAAQTQMHAYHAPVKIWELKTGRELTELPGKGAICKDLAFGADHKHLLLWSTIPDQLPGIGGPSYGSNSRVALACIDIATSKIVGETTIGFNQNAALSPDGETVAIENADHQSVHIRHLPSGTERAVLRVKQPRFAFTPDRKALFTVDENGRAVLWDTRTGKKIRDLEGTLGNKYFGIIGISKDSQTIAVLDGGWDSAPVVVWNAATGKRLGQQRPRHKGMITSLAFTPDGNFLVSGSLDRTVRLWNARTGEHVRVLTESPEAVSLIAISPDGKLVASASPTIGVRISTLADGKLVAEYPDLNQVATLTFSPDSKEFIAGGNSPAVVTRRVIGTGKITRRNLGEHGVVVAFGNGGSLMLVVTSDQGDDDPAVHLHVWNPADKGPSVTLALRDEKGGYILRNAAVFSSTGALIATSQISVNDGGIRETYGAAQLWVWERVSGQPIRMLAPTSTRALAFSPNGRLLASGAPGKSGGSRLDAGYGIGTDIWDICTGEKITALPTTPTCAAFSPDGTRLAIGGQDHCVLIWETPRCPRKVKAAAAERDAWWNALRGNAGDAYKAIAQMTDVPEEAVALLRERVRPIRRADAATVARLIPQLDSDSFAEREKAQKSLENMEEGAESLLAKALQGKLSAEARRRLNEIMAKCKDTSADNLRHYRAITALEWVGTPAAREVLRTLAEGAPEARRTMDARAALKRLNH
jgi:WD40 repeat protein